MIQDVMPVIIVKHDSDCIDDVIFEFQRLFLLHIFKPTVLFCKDYSLFRVYAPTPSLIIIKSMQMFLTIITG